MCTETLTFSTTALLSAAYTALSLPSPPPPQPSPSSSLPHTNHIPHSRFLVDHFTPLPQTPFAFFLSHFHSDHYAGISPSFSRGVIFASPITASLIIRILCVPSPFVVPLPMNRTVSIDGVEVMLVDANHCPGAVQFLFRVRVWDGEFRYVHTGDFRYREEMKRELRGFVGCDAVFLDTTYCDPRYVFPGQEEAVEYVVRVVEEKSKCEGEGKGKQRVLFLVATYVVGKERILLEVARRCGRKIWVDSRKMEVLRVLGYGDEKEGVFTEDEAETDVHVVGWNVLGETWPYFRPNFGKMMEIMKEKRYDRVVGIVPTGWTYEVKRDKFAVRTKDCLEIHLVPYSEHSNYEELREYVRFLKPTKVIPTVGVDVKNADSKHAAKMKKHFTGLVDEMANKQQFLMGFHRTDCQKDEKLVDDLCVGSCTSEERVQELKPPDIVIVAGDNPDEIPEDIPDGVPEDVPDDISVDVSCLSTYVSQPVYEDSTSLSDEEKEVIIKELHDCLPTWVDQGQMLELISSAGRNVVDAVSYFYEHETEFHENSSACKTSKFISQSHSTIDSNSSSNISQPQSSLLEVVGISQSQNRKSHNLKYSQSHGASISSGKRKRNQGSKGNKKARVISNVEGGIKQATITNFFNKLAPVTPQGNSAGNPTTSRSSIDEVALTPSSTKDEPADPMKGKCTDNEHASLADGDKPYEEALEQFMQVTNIGESARNYATTLIERAKGEINLALDIFYNNSEGYQSDNQTKLGSNSKPMLDGGGNYGCSLWQAEAISSEPGKISHTYLTSTSENVALTFVSLPMEKYSPVEHACWKDGQASPYIHLARTFDLLESEKGKIKATSMLCNMFRSLLALSPQDVLPAVYLCTNKIAPDHENMELNIGGGLVTAALVEACGTNRNKIRDMYNRLGDLGDVAQECRQTQSLLIPPPSLLIKDVFSALREISIQSGTGSTAKRKGIILGLMRSCRDKEIKFIVRTLVRNLRIGAMMKTVLPSLAQAVVMSSFASSHLGKIDDFKPQLQRVSMAVVEAYNILPNLDMLVPSLLSKGIEFSSSTLTMVPGIPIRPMLAKITNGIEQALKIFENRAFTCEYKYDGQRAQIHKFANGSVHIFSRNGDEITLRYPDVVHTIQDSCKCSATSFIIDTEVVAVDRRFEGKLLSFQELSSRERGGKRSAVALDSIEVNVCVFLFDIMFINGNQILSCSLRQRRNYMKALFDDERQGCLEYAKEITIEADDACLDNEVVLTKMNTFLEDAIHSSCEGIMVKSLDVDAGYFPSKRGDTWLKVKRDYVEGLNDSLDLVPIGAWNGNGRKAGWYSPFLVACYNPDTEEYESVCRVMSGFLDSFYTEMKDFFSEDKILAKKPAYYRTAETPPMWFRPEVVWAIRGADFTVSPVHYAAIGLVHPSRGISLRFPRFIRTVNDRRPEECSTSLDIADMFHSQTRKMDVSVASKK